MKQANKKAWQRRAMAALLAASAMVPASVQAKDTGEQDRWAAIEARLDKIEARIDGIEQRVETGQATQQDIATAREIRGVVADTRAETQAVSAKTDSLEQRVAAVEKKTPGSGFNVGSTNISIGGYVKLDAISERTSGGQLAGNAITRDFLLPSTIPVGGTASGWDTDFNARQSRIIIKTSTPVGDKAVGTLLEMDFMVTDGGDERVSNSYTPRMRQAYITYDGWLFGQAWSTFQNVGALPDSLDFVGTMPGTVFVRQPMIRYAKNGFSVAVEQPETTITTATGGRILPGDDSMPDVVVRYDKSGLAIAGIVRQLHASSLVLPTGSDSAFGYGVSISGKVPLGESSDFRFMGTVGQGLGRYLGANIVNDAAIDANGKLDPITTYSGFAAFQHKWSPKLRSTLAGSYFKADNPILFTGTSPTDTVWNALANIIYSPVPKLDVGIEYMYAERENEAGLSGNLQKVQVSAKYSF